MDRMSGALGSLLVDVAASRRAPDEKTWQRMLGSARVLTEVTHALRDDKTRPFADPSIGILAAASEDDARELQWALHTRNLPYARGMLFTVANGCVGCHARNATGPQFSVVNTAQGEEKLLPIERATLQAATRRFDAAMDGYFRILASPDGPERDGLDWDRAASAALSIAVRVKRDPVLAMRVADTVADHPNAPLFMVRDARAWRRAIASWQAEPAPSPATSEESLYARARALLDESATKGALESRAAAAVELLRAAAAAHDQLDRAPDGPLAADALLMLGVAYGQLEGLELWTVDLRYFAACIRKRPHTTTSARCFEHYEAATWREFAGTATVTLPPDVEKRLAELRKLAL